jgi:hypothetical protein
VLLGRAFGRGIRGVEDALGIPHRLPLVYTLYYRVPLCHPQDNPSFVCCLQMCININRDQENLPIQGSELTPHRDKLFCLWMLEGVIAC